KQDGALWRGVRAPLQPLAEGAQRPEQGDARCAECAEMIDRTQRGILQTEETIDRRLWSALGNLTRSIGAAAAVTQQRNFVVGRDGDSAVGRFAAVACLL